MDKIKNPFPKDIKALKSKGFLKYILISLLIIISATLIFYFGNTSTSPVNTNNELVQPEAALIQNEEDLSISSDPASIDLGMVESDLDLTDKNLKTIDNLDNL